MINNSLKQFALLPLSFGILSSISLSVAADTAESNGVGQEQAVSRLSVEEMSSIKQKTRVIQGSLKQKISAGDRISLSRRTETKKNRSSQILTGIKQQNEGEDRDSKIRQVEPQSSKNAFGFSFYDAKTYLNVDLDGDGFYSDFSVEFDADYEYGSANVFAVVYTSQNGGDWIELFETSVFNIDFDNTSDTQTISTLLNFGFPTGSYDVLIDLYEEGVSGIVATIEPTTDADLFDLPLEDDAHEVSPNSSEISFVASQLSSDFDGDGFYTDLTLEYDIDTQFIGDVVYTEIVVTDTYDGSRQFINSDNFILGSQTEFIDLTFNAGYPAGWYNIQINVINAFTGELVADAAQEFSSLSRLSIESINNDDVYDSFDDDVDIVIHSGSFGFGLILMGLFGLLGRRKTQS